MILDKLMEKKDLIVYINYRIKHLQVALKGIKKVHIKARGDFNMRTRGKIIELTKLKRIVSEKKLRDMGKNYWREAADDWLNDEPVGTPPKGYSKLLKDSEFKHNEISEGGEMK